MQRAWILGVLVLKLGVAYASCNPGALRDFSAITGPPAVAGDEPCGASISLLHNYWFGASDETVSGGIYNVSWLPHADPCGLVLAVAGGTVRGAPVAPVAAETLARHAGTLVAVDSDYLTCCRETLSHAVAALGGVAGIIYEKNSAVSGSGYFRTCFMPTSPSPLAPFLGINYDAEPAWQAAVAYAHSMNASQYARSPVTVRFSRTAVSPFGLFLTSPLTFATFRVILPALAFVQALACAFLLLRRKTHGIVVVAWPCISGGGPPIWEGLRASDTALVWQTAFSVLQGVFLAWGGFYSAWSPLIVTSMAIFIPEAASLWSSALMGSLFSRIISVRKPVAYTRDCILMTSVVSISLMYAIVVILNGVNYITATTFRNWGAPLALGVSPLITVPACVRILRAIRVLRKSTQSGTAPSGHSNGGGGGGRWRLRPCMMMMIACAPERRQQAQGSSLDEPCTSESSSRTLSPLEMRRSRAYIAHIKRYTVASGILIVTQLLGMYLTKAIVIMPVFYTPGGFYIVGVLSVMGPLGAGAAKILAFSTPRPVRIASRVTPRRSY
jgi:hypothetical protein